MNNNNNFQGVLPQTQQNPVNPTVNINTGASDPYASINDYITSINNPQLNVQKQLYGEWLATDEGKQIAEAYQQSFTQFCYNKQNPQAVETNNKVASMEGRLNKVEGSLGEIGNGVSQIIDELGIGKKQGGEN